MPGDSLGVYSIPGTREEGKSEILRNVLNKEDLTIKRYPEVTTIYDAFWKCVQTVPSNPYLGWREYDSDTGEYGGYVWQSYAEAGEHVELFGKGLAELYETHVRLLGESQGLGIYSVNRKEWLVGEYAGFTQHFFSVALYDTVGEEGLKFIVNHAELAIILCSVDKIPQLLKQAKDLPTLKVIISMDSLAGDAKGASVPIIGAGSGDILRRWAESSGVALYDMSEVEALGKQTPRARQAPRASDVCTICYTSGTTGTPKGAVVTHKQFISSAKAILGEVGVPRPYVFMSYLPLAHCYDRVSEYALMLEGGSVGFFSGDITRIIEDCQALQPTLFISVPRLLNRLFDKLSAATIKAPGITGMVARKGMAAKVAKMQLGGDSTHALWDRLLFHKTKAVLSRRLQVVATGSAPIDPEVLTFLRVAFCCRVSEGFGMTETCAMGVVQPRGDHSVGNVGVPLEGTELRLVDVPEMNYRVSDSPHPRGELLLRGEYLFSGYHKDHEKTDEAVDADGWLHSGDIAMLNDNMSISIIDRKKNIFKLSQGEYIAPEKIENALSLHQLIAQAFVYGDSYRAHLVAVVVPDQEYFLPWARGVAADKSLDLAALATHDAVIASLTQAMVSALREIKLSGFEIPKAYHIETAPFDTTTNQLLTPTFKLKRSVAAQHYADVIKDLYKK